MLKSFSNFFSSPLTKKLIGSVGDTLIDNFVPSAIRNPLKDVLKSYTNEVPDSGRMDVELHDKPVYSSNTMVGRPRKRRANRNSRRATDFERDLITMENNYSPDIDTDDYNIPYKRVKLNRPDFLLT